MPPFVIFLFFAAALVAVIVGIIAHYKRKKALREFADRIGFVFADHDALGLVDKLNGFSRFNRGHSRRSYEQVFGRYAGMDCCLFSYSYKTGSGKNESTHTFNGLLVVAPIFLPCQLTIRPEGFMDTVLEAVGFDDIDFEYNEFNKRYFVKCSDKRAAYDFFGRDMMDFFVMLPRYMSLDAVGPLFVFHYNGRLAPEFWERMLDTATSMFRYLDPHAKEKFAISTAAQQHFGAPADPMQWMGGGSRTGKGFFG